MADHPTEAEVREMLWLAFRAGMDQGHDCATAYEWGAVPQQSDEAAFGDFMAEWNADSATFRRMFPTSLAAK